MMLSTKFWPIAVLLALTSSFLFGGAAALVSPQHSPAAGSCYRSAPMVHPPNSLLANKKSMPSRSASYAFQRQPSALHLGFNNNNNNNNIPNNNGGGGGANDMDPGLKLLVCILIDFIGVASFAAPGLGEATDVGWAPISALLVNFLFGNGVFTALALVEELAPGLDVIPTATIAWFLENANKEPAAVPPPPEANNNNNYYSAQQQPSTQQPPPPGQQPPQSRRPPASDVIDVDIVD
mmetsp:Transcript_3361/g.7672  ORF Transcript_3361/g.7672 Transcript_3361/m.7672 type:complete len:237 (-) Transcript_3361:54-764(-)